MLKAIKENKYKFVELFMDHGVNLNEFATPEVFDDLYNNVGFRLIHFIQKFNLPRDFLFTDRR